MKLLVRIKDLEMETKISLLGSDSGSLVGSVLKIREMENGRGKGEREVRIML